MVDVMHLCSLQPVYLHAARIDLSVLHSCTVCDSAIITRSKHPRHARTLFLTVAIGFLDSPSRSRRGVPQGRSSKDNPVDAEVTGCGKVRTDSGRSRQDKASHPSGTSGTVETEEIGCYSNLHTMILRP
jgi:hypothetical protein